VLSIAVILIVPLLTLNKFGSDAWQHIKDNLLLKYSLTTFALLAWVMFFSGLLGLLCAYFVVCFRLPFKKQLNFLLHLPLAIPPYINAFIFYDILSPMGFIHRGLGVMVPLNNFYLAVLVFTLSLFPYVYISVKGALLGTMANYIENARMLGQNNRQIFVRVIMPLSQGAILSGMLFVGLETLGDFAVGHYLGVPTFSSAIFRAWTNFRDFDSALRLGFLALLVVVSLLFFKNMVMHLKNYSPTTSRSSSVSLKKLSPLQNFMVAIFFIVILVFALVIPMVRLIGLLISSLRYIDFIQLKTALLATFMLPLLTSLLILLLAIILASFTRRSAKIVSAIYGQFTLVNYSQPGVMVAMVTLLFFVGLEQITAINFTAGFFMLIVGYVLRYLGVAYENINNGYKKLGLKYHEASRMLGKGYFTTLFKVDLPLLKPSLIAAISLIIIDLVKELPLTIVLGPFNFNTLATMAYHYASDERLPQAALPSLLMIAISIVFISILLNNRSPNKKLLNPDRRG
jgi:iron(III) transport system permease protein